MKIIKIIKNGIESNRGTFDSEEKAESWLSLCLAKNKFGLPERPELDEQGNPTGVILPPEFEIVREDYEEPVEEKRRRDYQKEVDPYFHEAILDFIDGKPEKANALLKIYKDIKQKHPKK